MKKFFLIIFAAFCLSPEFAVAAMSDYCQTPPFITTPASPNVLMVVDTSGSMTWDAYSYGGAAYNSNVTYEGYFDPDQNYTVDANGVYVESNIAGCTKVCSSGYTCQQYQWGNCESTKGTYGCSNGKYACCSSYIYSGPGCAQNTANGNYLNYSIMTRIDLVRWAMTGGRPFSCNNSIQTCDPETYPNAQISCDANGCILQTYSGIKVKAPWNRVTGSEGGLLFQLKGLPLKPRMGSMYFEGTGVYQTVRIGDFTGSASFDGTNPYKNTITALNSVSPNDSTPTGPALWDAYNYFAQNNSQYGGPDPDTNISGNPWKDPEYQCFDKDGNGNCQGNELVKVPCAKNFVILLTDGQWNMGGNPGHVGGTCTYATGYESHSADPVVPAYWMHKGFTNQVTGDSSRVDAVYALGLWLGGTGITSLKNVAMYGSYDNTAKTWPDSLTDYPKAACNMTDCGWGAGSACTPLPASSADWDSDNNGIPDTFFNASNASDIKDNLVKIINDILKKASSGTAVSVLSSSEGSGANLMQALFYPSRSFLNNTEVSWTSDLMSYWYYLDPFLSNLQIREDTVRENANYTLLDLKQDYITSFTYDTTQNQTVAHRWQDTAGTGSIATATDKGTVAIERSIPIWRAGFNLWWTDPSARNIYTSLNGTTLTAFTAANSASLEAYLGQTTVLDASKTINYSRGYDYVDAAGNVCVCDISTGCSNCTSAGYSKIGRNRTVTTGVCSSRKSPCSSASDCPSGETCNTETHVWKMGDVISSTPRIMGPGYLETYNSPSPFGYSDTSYSSFITSNDYKNRQLAFVGSNDGMLHAFKIGQLVEDWSGKNWYEAAKQIGVTGAGGMGSESFAFVPKNALPYLAYQFDPDYCHTDIVDGPINIADVTINQPSSCSQANYWDCPKITTVSGGAVDYTQTSWRTVLIGSMGQGGATCNAATPDPDRISTPASVSGNPVGWSSYFALDVTNQSSPQMLWEFSNADLGVSNVGAGIVKEGGSTKRCSNNDTLTCSVDGDCGTGQCVKTNGRWFAVLASGPTGPISSLKFMGTSDKTLKIFVLDLKTGQLLRTIDTGITNAFAGSLSTGTIDLQRDRPTETGTYQDDALYIGYVQNTTSGGVIRLVMNNNADPSTWTWSKVFADGQLGPITSSVATLLDRANGKLWLYFAEGRYFYKDDDLTPATNFRMFGVQDLCFNPTTDVMTNSCSTLSLTNLQDQSTAPSSLLPAAQDGWYISLNAATATSSAERVISNPTADTGGAIYFLSFAPTSDVCSYGGNTSLWAVDYLTGGKVTYALQGKALVQVSSGEIKELDLSNVFTQNDNRKSAAFYGIPPAGQGVPIINNPKAVKKFMHIQEK